MPNVEELPFSVAHPLSYVSDASLPATDRVHNAQFAAYQAIRTTALLLLADYLDGEILCRAVGDAILGLRLPHWKEWVELCTSLAKFWRGHYPEARPAEPTRFPALVDGWLDGVFARNARKSARWEALLQGLPGGQGPARNAVDAFWTIRNRRAHAEGTRTGDDSRDQEYLRSLAPLLDAMLDALFPGRAFDLYRRVSDDDPRVIRLHGPHRDMRFQAEDMGPEWEYAFSGSSVVAVVDGEAVPIHPLFLAFDPGNPAKPGGSGGLIEDLYLIDGLSERKVVALGVLNWKSLSDPLSKEVRTRFEARQVEFGLNRQQTKPWTLVDWTAARSSRRLADMMNRKYFPAFYLERRGVDDMLRRVLGVDLPAGSAPPPRGRALLLLGEAGAGKSSILARLVERLLPATDDGPTQAPGSPEGAAGRLDANAEQRGARDVVFFLSGADAYPRDRAPSPDQLLCEAVTRQGEVKRGEFNSLADFCKELSKSGQEDRHKGRKIWIVLDALNEADRFTDLVEALDSFLPEVAQYSWLRLVVSMRSGAYHSLALRDESAVSHGPVVFRNGAFWLQFAKGGADSGLSPGFERRTSRDDETSPLLAGPGRQGPPVRPQPSGEEKTVPYLDVRPFVLETEGKESYRLRQAAPGIGASRVPCERLDRSMRELLLSPLHLHLFHETFHGSASVPAALSETKLLDAYLDQLAERMPGLSQRLLQLGEVMRETRRALLPMELAETWVKEWRSGTHGAADRIAKLDPVEELVSASVLMRPVEEGEGMARRKVGYAFSHQKLAETVLVRALEARLTREMGSAVPTTEGLLALAQEAAGADAPFEEMVGAVGTLVARAVERGDGASVATLLDLDSEDVRIWLVDTGLYSYGLIRGNTKDPTLIGKTFWTSLGAALSSKQRRERFADASWSAGQNHIQEGRSRTARDIADMSLEIMHELVDLEPSRLDWLRGLTISLERLSDLLNRAGEKAQARALVEESLAIRRELIAAEPGRLDFRRDLTYSLNRLSDLLDWGERAQSRDLVEESLAIRRELIAAEPGRLDFLEDLTDSLDRLSSLLHSGEKAQARELVEKSLAIKRELIAAQPNRLDLKGDFANSLDALSGTFFLEDENRERALKEESLAIERELAAAEPKRLDLHERLMWSLGGWIEEKGPGSARTITEEKLAIMRELVAAEPTRLELRDGLRQLLGRPRGELSSQKELAPVVREIIEETLAIAREQVAAEPTRLDLRVDLMEWLRKLRNELPTEKEWPLKRALLEESLEIARELVAARPEEENLQDQLRHLLEGLSHELVSAGETTGAQVLLEENLKIARERIAAEPGKKKWQYQLRSSFESLSHLLVSVGETTRAKVLLTESLSLERERVAAARSEWKYKEECLLHLKSSLDNLSDVLVLEGETGQARVFMEESLAITRKLVEDLSEVQCTMQDVTISLRRLNDLFVSTGQTALACVLMENNLAYTQELVARAITRDQVRSLGNLESDAARADVMVKESLAIVQGLVTTEPEELDCVRRTTASLNRLASLLHSRGETNSSRAAEEERLAFLRELVAAAPGKAEWRNELAMQLYRLSGLLVSAGDIAQARAFMEESSAELRELVVKEEKHYQGFPDVSTLRRCMWLGNSQLGSHLIKSLNRTSDLLFSTGDTVHARALGTESVAIARELVDIWPDNVDHWRDLTVSIEGLSSVLVSAGEASRARALMEESVAIARELVATAPDNVDYWRELAGSLERFSDLLDSAGAVDQARALVDASLEIRRELLRAETCRLDLRLDLAISLKRLRYLSVSPTPHELMPLHDSLYGQRPPDFSKRGDHALAHHVTEEVDGLILVHIDILRRSSEALDKAGISLTSYHKRAIAQGIYNLDRNRHDMDSVAAAIQGAVNSAIEAQSTTAEPIDFVAHFDSYLNQYHNTHIPAPIIHPDLARWIHRAETDKTNGQSTRKWNPKIGRDVQLETVQERALLEESMAIIRELVAAEPGRIDWRSCLTILLRMLSESLVSAGETARARTLLEEGLAIRRELVSAEPMRLDWRHELTLSMGRLSDLLVSTGETDRARALMEESLGLTRKLVAAEPTRLDWRRDMAAFLDRMGELTVSTAQARKLVEEGLRIMSELVAAEPGRMDWRRDLTALRERLSDLLVSEGGSTEALLLIEESAGVPRVLSAKNGRLDGRRDMAFSLLRLSFLPGSDGKTVRARALMEESEAIMRELIAAEPGRLDWRRDLPAFLERLSGFLLSAVLADQVDAAVEEELWPRLPHEKLARSRALLEESLGIRRELLAEEPTRFDRQRDLAALLERLSDVLVSVGETTRACELLEEKAAIMGELLAAKPGQTDLRRDLAALLERLSDRLISEGESARARAVLEESLAITREPYALEKLSDLLVLAGDAAGARELLDESLTIRRAAKPEEFHGRLALANSLEKLSELLILAGEAARARAVVEESLWRRRALVEVAREWLDGRRSLSFLLERLSGLLVSAGETVRARNLLQESLAIRRDLVAAEPSRLDWRQDLTVSMERLSDMLLSAGETADARKLLEEKLKL